MKSILYSNAVISCRANKMINSDRIKRMVNSANFSELAKVLLECGYDENVSTHDDEQIIRGEFAKTVETFQELCPDGNLLTGVLLKYDYHNAKVFYKSKFREINLSETVYPLGNIEPSKLKEQILSKNYAKLPESLRKALSNLDKKFLSQAVTSAEIDLEIEKAMYEDIVRTVSKMKNKSIKNYFKTEIDLLNIKTWAKCRLYLSDESLPDTLFVAGGKLEKKELNVIYQSELSKIKSAFSASEYYDLMAQLVECLERKDLTDFEDYATIYLTKVSGKRKSDLFDVSVLFNWFILKLEELKAVKVILTGKKFNLSKHQLRENLRGAYEIFG